MFHRRPGGASQWVALALLASVAVSCEEPDPLRPELLAPRAASSLDPVVAEVDGRALRLSRVEQLSRELGKPPRDVLEGMVEMALLAGEAERRGLLDEPDAAGRIWKKALVQAILEHEVERKVDPDSVTQDEVVAFYAANFQDRGILLEDVWRDIWSKIVIDRRHELYSKLIERARRRTRVSVDEQNVLRWLGDGGAFAGGALTGGGDVGASAGSGNGG